MKAFCRNIHEINGHASLIQMKHELFFKMPNYLHEKQSRFSPQNYRISLCSQLVGKHKAFPTAQPKQYKKPQKQNTSKLHLAAVWGLVPTRQVRRGMGMSHPTEQQLLSNTITEPREVRAGAQQQGTKSVCSPLFAQCQGPGLCPKRKVTPQSRITAWDTREDFIVPTGSLPALLTLPAPLTTCGNWDDLARGQHPPWTQCWSILTELVLTVLSTSLRTGQHILHNKTCPWLLHLVFQCRFCACQHASTLSVFNFSSLLKYTSKEHKAKTTHSQILPEAPFTSPQHVLHT